jgi:hypothetical protein
VVGSYPEATTMASGATTMARPKKGASAKAGEQDRETVIHMKGSPDYVAWLDDVHRKTHIPKVQIFRIAVAEWAKQNGHPEPPEI